MMQLLVGLTIIFVVYVIYEVFKTVSRSESAPSPKQCRNRKPKKLPVSLRPPKRLNPSRKRLRMPNEVHSCEIRLPAKFPLRRRIIASRRSGSKKPWWRKDCWTVFISPLS